MNKALRVIMIAVVLVSVLSGTASALDIGSKSVELTVDSQTKVYKTKKDTVGEFLNEKNIDLDGNDIVQPMKDELLLEELTSVEVVRGFNVNVSIDGIKEKIEVSSGTTIEELLNRLESQNNQDYIYNGDREVALEPNQQITIRSHETQTIIATEIIPFETEIIWDETLKQGTEEIVNKGIEGKKEVVREIGFLSGKEAYREVLSEKITLEPVNEVVRRGIAQPVVHQVEVRKYLKEFLMSATAYTAGYESTGKRPGDKYYGITASGLPVGHGIVAVDPDVIPLGTRLYVEGYGEAIAADTGGAIKGNKIDLFYESLDDALQFGRRNIKVYVIE